MDKETAIKVLFEENRMLLPTNRWAKYHQLEHELYHHNNIDSVFKNQLNVDLSKIIELDDNTDLKGELACAGGVCEVA